MVEEKTTEVQENRPAEASKPATAPPSLFTRAIQWFSPKRQAKLTHGENSLASLEDLEQLEESSNNISLRGKILAGLRGFILGAYTVISLALIFMSLIVLFSTLTFAAILTWYVVLPILLVAGILGAVVAYNSVETEALEQEKQQDYIEVSKTPTEHYKVELDISEKQFAEKFHASQSINLQASTAKIRSVAKKKQLDPQQTEKVIEKLETKYNKIKQDAIDKFIAAKSGTEFKIKELNKIEKPKGIWQTIKEKLTEWGSILRSPMGIFEGGSIMVGGALGVTATAGTGFVTVATGGAAVVATGAAAAVAYSHDNHIVTPRKENIQRLETELSIKVEATNAVKLIIPMSYNHISHAETESLAEVEHLTETNKLQQTVNEQEAKIMQLEAQLKSRPPSYTSSPGTTSPPHYSGETSPDVSESEELQQVRRVFSNGALTTSTSSGTLAGLDLASVPSRYSTPIPSPALRTQQGNMNNIPVLDLNENISEDLRPSNPIPPKESQSLPGGTPQFD